MKRNWPIIAVSDVAKSTQWYVKLLDVRDNHPGATDFNQLLDADGTIVLCLHWWGPSGPKGDHHWPSLASEGNAGAGNGLLLWFVVDDFADAWERARALGVRIEEAPNSDNGTRMPAFMVRDPDGYYVVVNQTTA